MTSVFSSYWDKDSIIYWDPENDTKGVEDGKRCCWDFEARVAHTNIHKVALQHKKVAHLIVDSSKNDTSCPYGKQPYD